MFSDLQSKKKFIYIGTLLILTNLGAEDFWSRAMDIHYRHRVSFFNSIKIKQGSKIFIGDSITEQCNWNELFNDGSLINRGIGGDVTEKTLKRLDFLENTEPSTIFLQIGTNDISQNKPVEQIADNYKKIVQKILTLLPNVQIYVQSVLPINQDLFLIRKENYNNENIDLLNNMIKKLEGGNIKYLDLNKHFKDSEGNLSKEYSSDGLHLNGSGYQRWKNIFIQESVM